MLELDKADKNSQRPETYDAMRKTTESVREAKDQITEQTNKYARHGGRRYRQTLNGSEEGKTEGCMKHELNGREESETARDWDPRTHEQTARDWDPRTHEERAQPTAGGQATQLHEEQLSKSGT